MEKDWDYVFIQWKGTDVCCDITCPNCEKYYHFDGYLLYSFKCGKCGKVFRQPTHIGLTKVGKESDYYYDSAIQLPESDES